MDYNFIEIEKKWQKIWDEKKVFKTDTSNKLPKQYILIEFPYPSGVGIHVGHPRPYTAMDVVSRKKRLDGNNVLFCMGWDAFGLPTENFAIKNKVHPKDVTKKNVESIKNQLRAFGFSFDWDREINTTDPDYYKWTQWIFLQMFKKGLAYKKEFPINWCTECKVGLANEEVVGGMCERCGSEVVQKKMNQWMLKITEYADRLIDDLKEVDYSEKVKTSQINWIGRSYGMEVDFNIKDEEEKFRVFTTRPDTIYGATYMVMSPEHPYLEKFESKIKNMDEIKAYQKEAKKKSEFERAQLVKEKTGVMVDGLTAINPLTNKEIPIWISDYVLMSYGTGAIMAVPAHDERDYEFAKVFNMPIIKVVDDGTDEEFNSSKDGIAINSELINGLKTKDAIEKISDYIEEKGIGQRKVNFKLRDWVFSRQRYWGEPIPVINCPSCGYVPMDEKDLPLTLPDIKNYETTDNGESPLANVKEWVNVKCPKCNCDAKRETDTMPQWAGSSWYYLRYMDPFNEKELVSKENMEYFNIVDWYNGGMEHTTLHLLYSRFWHKFLYDIGVVNYKEPYMKRTSHGMILGEDNEKMSKSRGNTVNPDDLILDYGADSLRLLEMFIGDFNKTIPWSTNSMKGCKRFLDRTISLLDIVNDSEEYSEYLIKEINKSIKKVTEDIENLKFNTAIANLMSLINIIYKEGYLSRKDLQTFIILLNPFAPHITEEINELMGNKKMITEMSWPKYDEKYLVDDEVEVIVQVNGKVRSKLLVAADLDSKELEKLALEDEKIKSFTDNKNIVKVIVIKNKIVNIVVK